MMKKTTLLLSGLLVFVSGIASAGQSNRVPVEIDTEAMLAFGDMRSARMHPDENMLIGCGTRNIVQDGADPFTFAFCQAQVEDNLVSCFTEDATLINAVHGLDDFSFIIFRWDEEGNCTSVGSSTQSLYLSDKK